MRIVEDLFQNRYGKYSLSKIIPAIWFVYLLVMLSTVFRGKDIPSAYYQLTAIFSSVYVGRAAVDKFGNSNATFTTTPTIPVQPTVVTATQITPTPTVVTSTPVTTIPVQQPISQPQNNPVVLSNAPPPPPSA